MVTKLVEFGLTKVCNTLDNTMIVTQNLHDKFTQNAVKDS